MANAKREPEQLPSQPKSDDTVTVTETETENANANANATKVRRMDQSRCSMPNVGVVNCELPSNANRTAPTATATGQVVRIDAEQNDDNLTDQERKFMRLLERVQSKRIEDQRAHFHSERSKKKADRQGSGRSEDRSSPSAMRNSKSAHKMQPQPKSISGCDTTFFEALVDSQMMSRYNDQRCAFLPKHRGAQFKQCKRSNANDESKAKVASASASACDSQEHETATTQSQSSAVSNDSSQTTKPKNSSSTPSTSASASNDPSCSKSQDAGEADSDDDNDLMSLIWRLQSSRLNDQRARLPNREASASASGISGSTKQPTETDTRK